MVTLAPDHDFQTQLAQARLEALTILRRAMTDEEHPPGKEAIQAATAILRLPKYLTTTTPCHAGDEPSSSSPSFSPSTANPRVSPAPHSSLSLSEPPATPEGRREAHPRVSPSPHRSPSEPPPTPEARHEPQPRVSPSPHTLLLNHTPTPNTTSPPFPIPSRSSSPISRLLARAGAAHPP